MRKRRISKLALALTASAVSALLIFPNIAHSDTTIVDPDESWSIPNEMQIPGSMGARFIDNSGMSQPGLSYLTQNGMNPSNSDTDPTCDSTSDTKCDFSNFNFMATLPTCTQDSEVNCIAEVGAYDLNGTKHVGIFSRYMPDKAQNQYVGNPDWNLPSGVGASVFTIPDVNNPAGNTYIVSANMDGHGQHSASKKSITLEHFSATIIPVQIVNIAEQLANTGCPLVPRICNPGVIRLPRPDGTVRWGLTGGAGDSCKAISFGENLCARKQAFPINYRFYMKMRLTLMPTGWMHGRLSDPLISVKTTGKVSELEVTALPVKVPIVFKRYIWNEMPPALQKLYVPTTGSYIGGNWSGSFRLLNDADASDPMKRAMLSTPPSYENAGITELVSWLPYVGDKAVAAPSYWSVRSLSGSELADANSCFTNPKQLNGIVTTNSTQYSAGPPVFDKTEGFLNYKVASPHFTSSGDVFKGSYDLAMRSDVARCIYGFSKAPVSAKVSVVSADGTPQVATTVFSESDGWVYLKARNFEFSSPSVRVKLEQEAPAPTQTKTTITCVKNKLTKKVTAVSPKCPTGYKKK